MAGRGDLLEAMRQRASNLNLSGYFEFPGFIPDNEIGELFGQSDVFVMPSVSEPFGIVALEAMRSGLPVVVSKQSGVSEVVKHVAKVDYWDVKSMAAEICKILRNPRHKRTLSQHGKLEAARLTWEQTACRVAEIYSELLRN
jgi:glycosyltransferase involved in cell wall biosynthesis